MKLINKGASLPCSWMDANNTHRKFTLTAEPSQMTNAVTLMSDFDEELVTFDASEYEYQYITGGDGVWYLEFTHQEYIPPEPGPEPEYEPSDHEVLNKLLGVTE